MAEHKNLSNMIELSQNRCQPMNPPHETFDTNNRKACQYCTDLSVMPNDCNNGYLRAIGNIFSLQVPHARISPRSTISPSCATIKRFVLVCKTRACSKYSEFVWDSGKQQGVSNQVRNLVETILASKLLGAFAKYPRVGSKSREFVMWRIYQNKSSSNVVSLLGKSIRKQYEELVKNYVSQ